MKILARCIVLLSFVLGVSGCAGLGKMQVVEYTQIDNTNKALVNIVRRRVFMGDGAKVEAWDGDKFIGTLAAGTMLQYEADPGEHTFMTYVQGSWALAKGELKPGKTYFLKYNQGFGFTALGVAKSDDTRISEWESMKTVTLNEDASKPVPQKYLDGARAVLTKLEAGNAKYSVIDDSNAL